MTGLKSGSSPKQVGGIVMQLLEGVSCSPWVPGVELVFCLNRPDPVA